MIAASDFLAFDEAAFLEFLHDPLDGPFGNAHGQSYFPQHQFRSFTEYDKYMGMVSEKGPAVSWLSGYAARR